MLSLPSGQTIATEVELTTAMKKTVDLWEQIMDKYNRELFNGSDTSIDSLQDIIGQGQFVEGAAVTVPSGGLTNPFNLGNGEGVLSMTASVTKTLYAKLIPLAWAIGPSDNGRPFIL